MNNRSLANEIPIDEDDLLVASTDGNNHDRSLIMKRHANLSKLSQTGTFTTTNTQKNIHFNFKV